MHLIGALELGAYAARAWSFMESLEDLRKELFLQNLSFSSLSMEPGRHPLLWPWTAAAAGMRTSEEEEPELSSVNGMWRRVTDRRASSVKALATSTIRLACLLAYIEKFFPALCQYQLFSSAGFWMRYVLV